jgi:hypothetical protein
MFAIFQGSDCHRPMDIIVQAIIEYTELCECYEVLNSQKKFILG